MNKMLKRNSVHFKSIEGKFHIKDSINVKKTITHVIKDAQNVMLIVIKNLIIKVNIPSFNIEIKKSKCSPCLLKLNKIKWKYKKKDRNLEFTKLEKVAIRRLVPRVVTEGIGHIFI